MFFFSCSKQAIEAVQFSGKICILDIDTQGVKLIKKTNLNPWLVFIKPPSLQILEERLRARSTETEDSLQKRLNTAKVEMEYGNFEKIFVLKRSFTSSFWKTGEEPGNFDVTIVNDNLEAAYEELKQFLLPIINELRID